MAGKLKLPLPYISNSSFALFQIDPMAWYQQYYVARVREDSKPMTLGSIFQEAWCNPKYDYVRALHAAGFNGDKARAMKTSLEHKQTVRLPKSKTEKTIIVKGAGLKYPIMAKFDGLDPDATLIVENKWGAVWTQKRVDDGLYFDQDKKQRQDRQITWYILAYKIKYGRLPKFLLQSFNGKNGIPNQFWAKRTLYDLDKLVFDINSMVDRIEAGDFNPR